MKILSLKLSSLKSFFILLFTFFISGYTELKAQENLKLEKINKLTHSERKEGWRLAFNGKTFKGWRGLGMETVPVNWKIEDGCLRNINIIEVTSLLNGQPFQISDLITYKKYENFELYFEWKITAAGNTGIKYNVSEEMSKQYGSRYSALGFEYQLLDDYDVRYKDKLKPSQFSGSLYDLIPAINVHLKSVGEFNNSRIVVNDTHCEHWLNGVRIVEFEFGSALLDSAYQKSKFNQYPGFHEKRKGHIVLQSHKDDAWFRNLKIREFKTVENKK